MTYYERKDFGPFCYEKGVGEFLRFTGIGIEYERVGAIARLRLFGATVYEEAGSARKLLGFTYEL